MDGKLTTLPDDYARCHGQSEWHPAGGAVWWKRPCRDCLRRTAPMWDNKLYSYMTPPKFTTTCPERIAP